ncbi:cyclic nucleotide-binding domain-containing protein [Waterburya agarophytonicola K14]|uniref:Cyclic nucleotide-binding domain-containing protein n=1 Tax=Waterburya agarophytonicola KI4 TaxID=2874699 RepID=A0A964FE95_9CYAN|nr:cyclic nucleotide-binding domain-containing protein [Waterburya agarophytonicola]MCC0175617.1 cyclic nucleotide-binding domain-containing protein [Waterburya agarophytonicola KI4]
MLSPVKTVEIFQTSPSPQTFAPGEVIFADGDSGDVMYGLVEGEVEITVNGKVLETIHQGDIFGEGALVHLDSKRASTAIAKTECKLALMERKHFLFAVQQTPMFGLEIMRSYSDRIRRLRQSVVS